MGATYLSMPLRTTDRDAAVAALKAISEAQVASGLQFYVTDVNRDSGHPSLS